MDITSALFRYIAPAVVLLIVACGGGGGGSSGGDGSGNSGWVSIDTSSINSYANGEGFADVSGKAFVSTSYVAHHCIGLECITGWFDDSYPGVDVRWMNASTGGQGNATSRYGTATSWEHLWHANIPVVSGNNSLRITAADPVGNSSTANLTVQFFPSAPSDLRGDTGDGEVTLLWSPVPGATGYRIYWATSSGVDPVIGTAVAVNASPYVHNDLANGTTYYYVITSLYQSHESIPSAEIAATAGAPSQPKSLAAVIKGSDIELSWDAVATADTYTLYWANEAGVNKRNGTPIPAVIGPYLHTGLSGLPYFYVVTAVNGNGESLESEETTASPPLAPPPPADLTATQVAGLTEVDVSWQLVQGVYDYTVYRCEAWSYSGCIPAPNCAGPWENLGTTANTRFVDWKADYYAYQYYVTSRNDYGSSLPSEWAGLCVTR